MMGDRRIDGREVAGGVTMRRDDVLAILSSHRDELDGFYVKSLSIFGSVARDEAGPESDVDVLVEFTRPVNFFHLFALEDYLESLLGRRVDLTTAGGLKRQ